MGRLGIGSLETGRSFAGHHKRLFLVAVIPVGGHEPSAEAVGHFQAEDGIGLGRIVVVDGLVP